MSRPPGQHQPFSLKHIHTHTKDTTPISVGTKRSILRHPAWLAGSNRQNQQNNNFPDVGRSVSVRIIPQEARSGSGSGACNSWWRKATGGDNDEAQEQVHFQELLDSKFPFFSLLLLLLFRFPFNTSQMGGILCPDGKRWKWLFIK